MSIKLLHISHLPQSSHRCGRCERGDGRGITDHARAAVSHAASTLPLALGTEHAPNLAHKLLWSPSIDAYPEAIT
jgi:hypothetical protein